MLRKKDALKHIIYTMQIMDIKPLASTIQKVVYILREMGVPVFYRYNVYFYGPYSNELDEDLYAMKMWDEIRKEDDGSYEANINTFSTIDFGFIEKVKDKINSLMEITCIDLSDDSLKIVQFILYSMKALENFDILPTKDNVIEEVKKWIGNDYKTKDISITYDRVIKNINFEKVA